jgi:hypothetical protein
MSYLRLGTWNAYCDVCAGKFKADKLKKRWDGFMVCPQDWEVRHPQDFLRAVKETSNILPWTRPVDFGDAVTQVPKLCNALTSSGLSGNSVAGCMVAGKPFKGNLT